MKCITGTILVLGSATLVAGSAPHAKPLELQEVLRVASTIDQLLEKDLKARKLQPLPIVPEDVFVRRTFLNIVGRIPTAMETSRFLDDKRPDKRTRLVEVTAQGPTWLFDGDGTSPAVIAGERLAWVGAEVDGPWQGLSAPAPEAR